MSLISPPIALSIAGFDPSSGAGVTSDLKTFSAFGIYGVACITALTVQSTLGVRAVEAVPADLIRRTLDCLSDDVVFAGIKIGMLGSGGVAREISSFLSEPPVRSLRARVVLDPVLRSSSGAPLIEPAGVGAIRDGLLAQVGWITPNIDELAILTAGGPVTDIRQVAAAARTLRQLAADRGNDELNIVITGGHFDRPDDFLLMASGKETWLEGERVDTNSTHGTGCAFSSALLCGLIAGESPLVAATTAKSFVVEALRSSYPVGKGRGPMNHLFRFGI